MAIMDTILWIGLAFVSGSLPFSVWIGRVFLNTDIRTYGDGNPGATNVYRASDSRAWFAIAILLDASKAMVPTAIAYWGQGFAGLEMALIAGAAVAGHAFSPFLRFRGGKAIAATFGIWVGLTIWEAPTVMGLLLTYWFLSVEESNWAVILMMLSLLAYLLLTGSREALLLTWLCNTVVVVYRHREGLSRPPTIKRWLPFLKKDPSQPNNDQQQATA